MSVEVPDLAAMMSALESAGPAALAAFAAPMPDRDTYLAAYPELAAIATADLAIPGPHGDVPARIYRHEGAGAGTALVWLHGGGFVGGDLEMPEAHWVGLALAARGYSVLSVDYRKCVDAVHYPVPADDVHAAWSWAIANAEQLDAKPERLHIGGASAGGSLAAGVTKRLRDSDGPMPASVMLAYPTLHPDPIALGARGSEESPPGLAHAAAILSWMSLNYAGSQAMLSDPYAFPGLGDVGRQPPVLIVTSESDTLRPSGETYGAALREAGVSVTVETEPGTGHGHLNDPMLPAAQRTMDRLLGWLASH